MGYAIRSVLAQTEQDFEFLVVGDGCSDDTASVIDSFADERISWFDLPKAPNFGYANRNVALREATGEMIAFMAHDDLLLHDHLELMGEALEQPEVEWAYSRPLWMDDAGVAIPFVVDLRRPEALRVFMEDHNSIPASCVVFRRDCLDRYGYWPEEAPRSGDWELWRRIIGPSGGANLAYCPAVTCIDFRANWRKGAVWGPSPLGEWLAESATSWWPEALRLRLKPDTLPQAEVWHRLEADPSGWGDRMREGVIDVVDGAAWASPELRASWQRAAERAEASRAASTSCTIASTYCRVPWTLAPMN